jgi:Chemotaxis signal transduction protein
MNNFLFSSEKNLTLFDTDNDYILFDISDELYAIKILDIKEIVSNRTIVEVEDLPEYIKGFANIRNIIFPIFELKQDLALENSKNMVNIVL